MNKPSIPTKTVSTRANLDFFKFKSLRALKRLQSVATKSSEKTFEFEMPAGWAAIFTKGSQHFLVREGKLTVSELPKKMPSCR